ncbi:hypothetical protein HYT25_00555 [Candidatus Pacearchaeota archaeon]|nr:hypothetical protein [Candidatus Pacearchaeota archaeon]
MGFFGFGKKDRIIDLSEKYRRQREKQAINNSKTQPTKIETKSPATSGMFGMFDSQNITNQPAPASNEISSEESPEEKRKRFMKKFSEMTERLDTMSTSLYHLSQRVELLEKKLNLGH